MRKILWLLALMLTAAYGSGLFEASDVAKLQPVELIRISWLGNDILVEMDTGEQGHGATLAEAFADLKEKTTGDIFLDTADQVLLTRETEELIPELLEFLRPACRVCLEDGSADLEKAAAFLDTHQPEITLMDCQNMSRQLPVLVTREGTMKLVS